jgi:hypothetical protein
MRPRFLPALLLAALPASACVDRPVSQVDPKPENIENLEFDVDLNPNLDLLFVIDNSGSMENEQAEVTAAFPQMMDTLQQLPTGLPNIHIGVISTDVGAGNACATADVGPGVLENAPRISGCTPPGDRYIEDIDDGSGGRTRNYGGTLGDTFSCIATLGTHGCGYEQPLEAIQRALDPSNAANADFLRDDSLLAVVILSDEDDCSAFDPSLFDQATPDGVDADFRCFEQGVSCDGPPDQTGVRENCVPNDDSPYITPISEYVQMLKQVRPFQHRLLVAGILGDSKVEVGANIHGDLDVLPSCPASGTNPEGAYPPTRTEAFLHQFQEPIRTRICESDLNAAIVEIGSHIVDQLYGGCIQGELANPNAPDCSVTEIQHPGATDEARTILPACNADQSNLPCWTIDEDPVCTTTDHLRVTTHYAPDEERDPDTIVQAQCRLRPGA